MKESIPDNLVVLTFDDGVKSQGTFVAGLLKRYGFGATFYPTEGGEIWGNEDHYLSWDEVRQLHDEGFEIGCHTRRHEGVSKLSAEELRAELEYIDRRCEEHGISKPETFCYPGYDNTPEAMAVLAEWGFRFARRGVGPEYAGGGDGDRGPAYDPRIHHPLLVPTTGAAGPRWKFEDFIWALEQARDGKIAVLTFHGAPDVDHPWVHTEPEMFERYMQVLAERDCTVMALRDLGRYVDRDSWSAA